MARKDPYRPTAPVARVPEPDLSRIVRGGVAHRLYMSLASDEREDVIAAIGLKQCQRIGHRHKVPELRTLTDLGAQWNVVDAWVGADDAVGGPRAVGDLFDPLVHTLVERARELLGEHADDPEAEHLTAMAEALAAERSPAQARLLLAVVVEFDFTASVAALAMAAADPRFALPVS